MLTAKRAMTSRERYLETLSFGSPDRVPFAPGGPRKSTLETWHRQGLPEGDNWFQHLCTQLGLELPVKEGPQPGVNFRMIPMFEEKVLEHRDGHYIVQDWMGNITEISDQYDVTYLRNALDFVTRRWHKFPVETHADFEAMKARYRTDQEGRYPSDFADRAQLMKTRGYATHLQVSGPFWQLREWCGFEPLCMLFIDDPDFVREMIAFWTGFVSQTMARALDAGVVDVLRLSEDMAYKAHPMISPDMTRAFLQPTYKRWVSEAKAGGVQLVDMDSDGAIDTLIPVWIESGIHVCDPIEVAAGNDLVAFRETFGRDMAYTGGVDKRAMAKGGRVIEAELSRLASVIKDGGYIPGCDHGVPPDISWPNFVHYAGLLAELTGWR